MLPRAGGYRVEHGTAQGGRLRGANGRRRVHPPTGRCTAMATKTPETRLATIGSRIAALQAQAEAVRNQEAGDLRVKA